MFSPFESGRFLAAIPHTNITRHQNGTEPILFPLPAKIDYITGFADSPREALNIAVLSVWGRGCWFSSWFRLRASAAPVLTYWVRSICSKCEEQNGPTAFFMSSLEDPFLNVKPLRACSTLSTLSPSPHCVLCSFIGGVYAYLINT